MKATLVLQKEILDDLFLREQEFESFINFLKKNFRNYDLIINHISDEELQKHSKDNPLIEILLDKIDQISFVENLEDILRANQIKNLCSVRTIVLCNLDDTKCNEYLDSSGLLFFNLNNLFKWNFFNEIVYSKGIKVTDDISIPNEYKFTGWESISKYLKYCDSIVMFDRYIFCDKSNQRLVHNLYPFLNQILSLNKNKVNLTIISEFEREEILIRHRELEKYLHDNSITNFNLNLIHHTKAFYPRNFEGIHSRFILSNYLHILSNDSFNFYKENGKFNNLADVDIKLNLNTKNKYSYLKDLNGVKIYVSKTKNEINSPNTVLKTTYFRDKLNPLFN